MYIPLDFSVNPGLICSLFSMPRVNFTPSGIVASFGGFGAFDGLADGEITGSLAFHYIYHHSYVSARPVGSKAGMGTHIYIHDSS